MTQADIIHMLSATELMEEILVSEEAKKIIRYVSPIYGNSKIALCLFQSIGNELDDLRLWVNDLREQSSPRTAIWALYHYQSNYGLDLHNELLEIEPGQKLDDVEQINRLRGAIISKIMNRASANPKRIEQIIQELTGRNIQIIENTYLDTFDLIILMGTSVVNIENIYININKIIPAHLTVNYFLQPTVSDLGSCTYKYLKDYTYSQISSKMPIASLKGGDC